MAISPISMVNTRGNSVNFGGRNHKDVNENATRPSTRAAGPLVAVPLSLLMALATTSPLTKAQAAGFDRNVDQTELLAYASPSEMAAPAPQTSRTSDASSSYPLGYRLLSYDKIFGMRPLVTPSGERATIVYSGEKEFRDGEVNKDWCQYMYYIPQGFKLPKGQVDFPQVKGLIHHDLGPDKEFASVIVKFPRYDYYTGELLGYVTKEVVLKDDDANDVIEVILNLKPFKNHIPFFTKEIKYTPELLEDKYTRF